MHILGVTLPDHQLARFALTHFHGIGKHTAHRICARVQIHDTCKVRDLSPQQVNALTAFLSAPASAAQPAHLPLASPAFKAPSPSKPLAPIAQPRRAGSWTEFKDPLKDLKLETDLRREIRENIAHHRLIGTYVGRRHALHLPVRGQNTHHNGKTAKHLNRIERR